MSANEYHFVTHWRVEGTAEEVFDVLDNAKDLVRWWPAEAGSAASPRVLARGLGRFRRQGRLDIRARWRPRRHHLRLAHQGREAAAPAAVMHAETDLLGHS